MTQAAPKAIAVAKVLDSVMRSDRGRLVAALVAGLRNLSLAEEALQEAAISALYHWGRSGIPNSPQGWLLTVARRKALDRLRSTGRDMTRAGSVSMLIEQAEYQPDLEELPDERLRLIFACCHPALEMKSRVALTLRIVCGLTTIEIARAFLDQETTMGQRLSRAKTKIAAAGIGFEVPDADNWPARLEAVLTTIYLIFTTGYVNGSTDERDLALEAEYLMRLINKLRPNDAEIEGALALILLTSARRSARIGQDGASVPPAEQDRSLWDRAKIAEGRAILAEAVARRTAGPFQIKAAISDCQMMEPAPDWRQIALLYQALLHHENTPVVMLNAAVAAAEAGEPDKALHAVEGLAHELADFQPFHAARAALLSTTGRRAEAADAYTLAIDMAANQADVKFLTRKLATLKVSN